MARGLAMLLVSALALLLMSAFALLLAPTPTQAAPCRASTVEPPCEMFTAIVNAAGRPVTNALVDAPVHPRVSFAASPSPSGTVRFEWFADAKCEGVPVARSGDFPVAGGVVEATGFTQIPRKVGGYAVLARYSGDGTHRAVVGDCQPLTVTRSAPRLVAAAVTVGLPEGDTFVVGSTVAVRGDIAITADAPIARLAVTHSYDRRQVAPEGTLPDACALVPDADSNGFRDAIVCAIPRVQLGPAVATVSRVFPLAFRAIGATPPEGATLTSSATFEFEGTGQSAPFRVGPQSADLHLIEAPRLSLPAETSGSPGQRLVVPVLLDAKSLRLPAEFRFALTYNPTLVRLDAVESGPLAAGNQPEWSTTGAGRANIAVSYPGGAGAGGASEAVALAVFTVLGSAGQGPLGLVGVEAVPLQGATQTFQVDATGGTLIVIPIPVPQAVPEPEPPVIEEEPERPGVPVLWDERLWTPEHVGTSFGFATLLGITLTALAEIFNSTVEENRNHFVGWWRVRRHRLLRYLRHDATGLLANYRSLSTAVFGAGVVVYLLAASVLFAFLEPERALETPDVAILAAGFAITATTLASQLPRWAYVSRLQRSGALLPPPPGQRLIELHADFWTLAFALVCVAVAYETAVRPGYAYGIVGVLAINRSLRLRPDHARGQLEPWHMDWLSMVCLFAAAVMAWVGYSIAHDAHSEVIAHLLERFWILGAETVALGMIPLSFLPGRSLWKWSRLRWAVLWSIALFLYIQSVTAHAVGAGPFAIGMTLGAYSLITVTFWLYFKRLHDEESCTSCRVVNASSVSD